MTDEMGRLALRAVNEAAEILGVDPFRLARFLSHGMIAQVMQSMGEGKAGTAEVETLARKLQEFLDEEKARARDTNGGTAAGG
jgi:hypothetical protein